MAVRDELNKIQMSRGGNFQISAAPTMSLSKTPTYSQIRNNFLQGSGNNTITPRAQANQQFIQSAQPKYTKDDLRQMQVDKGLSKFDDPFKEESWFQKLFNPIQDRIYTDYNKLVDDSSSNKWLDAIEQSNPEQGRQIIQNIATGLDTGEFKNIDGSEMTMQDGTKVKDYLEKNDVFKASLLISLRKKLGNETMQAALQDPRYFDDQSFREEVNKYVSSSNNFIDPWWAGQAIAQKNWLSGDNQDPTLRSVSKATGQFFNPVSFGGTRSNPFYANFNTMNSNEEKILGGLSEAAGFLGTMAVTAPIGKGISDKVVPALTPALSKYGLGQFALRNLPMWINAGVTGFAQYPGMGDRGESFFDIGTRGKNAGMSMLTSAGSTLVGGLSGKFLEKWGLSGVPKMIGQGIAGGLFDTGRSYLMGERDPAKLATEFGLGFAFGAKTGQDDIDALFGKKPSTATPQRDATVQKYNMELEQISRMQPGEQQQAALQDLANRAGAAANDPIAQSVLSVMQKFYGIKPDASVVQQAQTITENQPANSKFGVQEAMINNQSYAGQVERVVADNSMTAVQKQEALQAIYDNAGMRPDATSDFVRQQLEQTYGIEGDTFYRGGDQNGSWFTKDPNVAEGYGNVQQYRIKQSDILDLTNPAHRQFVASRLGEGAVNELSRVGGLPDGGDPASLEAMNKYGSLLSDTFKGFKVAETFAPDESYAPSVYMFDRSAVRAGDLRTPGVNSYQAKLGDQLVANKEVTTQQGLDQALQRFTQELQSGVDPNTAWSRAAKFANQEYGTNIPLKIKPANVEVPDLLDPALNIKKLDLPDELKADAQNIQNSFKEIALSELNSLAKGNDVLPWETGNKQSADAITKPLKIYHGTSLENLQSIQKGGFETNPDMRNNLTGEGTLGVSFSTDKTVAQKYSQQYGNDQIAEAVLLPGSKVKVVDTKGNGIDNEYTFNDLEALQKQGYDAIQDTSSGQESEVRVLNSKAIGTSDSLTGSFQMANKLIDQKAYTQVEKAITSGYVPKNQNAKQIYDQVLEKATESFNNDDLWNSTGAGDSYNKIASYLSEKATDQPNLETFKRYLDQTGKPFETLKANQLQTEDINSLTNLNKLKVADKYSTSKWDEVKTKIQNRAAPVEDLGLSAKASVRKVLGSDGIAVSKVFEELQPIIEKNNIQPGEDFDNAMTYLVQKRNLNLKSQGFEKGATEIYYPKDGIFGVEKTIKVPETFVENPKYEAFARDFKQFQDAQLDYAVQSGILRPEVADSLKASGDYVRYERVFDDIDNAFTGNGGGKLGSLAEQTVVQKYKGSDRAIYDPLSSTIKQMLKLEKQARMNDATLVTIRSMQEIPDLAPLVRRVDEVTGLGQDQYITALVNGEKQFYTAPPEISMALKSLPREQMGSLVKIAAAPSKWLRYTATQGNINFLIPNILRDQFNAGINSEFGYVPFVDYVSGLKSMITKDASYRAWESSGAEIFAENDPQVLAKMITPKGAESEFVSKVKSTVNPLNILRKLGEYSEVPTRIGLYKRAVSSGADVDQAMLESRAATSDFAVRGSMTKEVSAVIPFLNARIQGLDSTVQAFKRNPTRASLMTATYAVLPTIILQKAIESTPVYDQISDYDKDKYYIIPIKGEASSKPEDFIKVPKPNVAQWLNPLRKSYEYNKRGLNVNPAITGVDILSEINPIGGFEANQKTGAINVDPFALMPQIYKPLVEVASNYDSFRKRPVVSESVQNLPPGYQANSSTDPIFRDIGSQLSISPAKLQQLVYGYTAGLGKDISNAAGAVTGSNARYPQKARPGAPNTSGIPVLNRIFGIDLSTPTEQFDSQRFALQDLQERRRAIIRSTYIPERQKQIELQKIDQELQQLQMMYPAGNSAIAP